MINNQTKQIIVEANLIDTVI